jgi:type IV secretion system protein VirB9
MRDLVVNNHLLAQTVVFSISHRRNRLPARLCLIFPLLLVIIFTAAYLPQPSFSQWASREIFSPVSADGGTPTGQTSTDDENLPPICLSQPTNGGQNSTCAVSTDAKTVVQANSTANTQDIPDAIPKGGSFAFTYFEGGLYKVYTKEGFLTDVQLQTGEKINAILGGDTARWMVDKAFSGTPGGERWHVYIKPLKDGLFTNFIITTDRHNYQIQVQSGNWYCPMVTWLYPEEEAAIYRAQQEKEKETLSLAKTSPDRLNFSYKFDHKDYPWCPIAIFDDGLKTFIHMPSQMGADEAPVLLVKDGTGNLLLVNYRVQNNAYIVDRLFTAAELRVGKEVVKIKRLEG